MLLTFEPGKQFTLYALEDQTWPKPKDTITVEAVEVGNRRSCAIVKLSTVCFHWQNPCPACALNEAVYAVIYNHLSKTNIVR